MNLKPKHTLYIVLVLLILALVGCRGSAPTVPNDQININMDVSVAPNPPQVGASTLVVSLTEEDGTPIDGADIEIRGDMNHAGMQPVLRDGNTSENGDYRIPFEWTMGGDWFVVVKATLPGGEVIEQQFDFTVGGDGGMADMDMDATGTEEMDMDAMDMPTEDPNN